MSGNLTLLIMTVCNIEQIIDPVCDSNS